MTTELQTKLYLSRAVETLFAMCSAQRLGGVKAVSWDTFIANLRLYADGMEAEIAPRQPAAKPRRMVLVSGHDEHDETPDCRRLGCTPVDAANVPAPAAKPRRMKKSTHVLGGYHDGEHNENAECQTYDCEPVDAPAPKFDAVVWPVERLTPTGALVVRDGDGNAAAASVGDGMNGYTVAAFCDCMLTASCLAAWYIAHGTFEGALNPANGDLLIFWPWPVEDGNSLSYAVATRRTDK